MEKDEFIQCLDNITNGDEDTQSKCRGAIMDLRKNDAISFFELIFKVFEDESPSFSRIILCLSAIRDMFIPTNDFPLSAMTKTWFSEPLTEIRVRLKNFVITFVHDEEIAIRNVSASVFALIFALERKKLTENSWPEAVSKLVDEFVSEDTVVYYKHGIMTFFHELLILPIFKDMKEEEDFIQNIGSEINRFLFQLIQNLKDPESNPKDVFDYSILCIYDLITYLPEIFDGEKVITDLFDSYESTLPIVDSNQYQQLFEIIFEIISNFYDHISVFEKTIFYLSSKGIDCPNDELVCISIELWVQIAQFEKKKKKIDDDEKITKRYTEPLIKLLLNVISENKENTLKQAISLLQVLSECYTEYIINISLPVIDRLINNDEDIIGIFVSLALIKGICSKRSSKFEKFVPFFNKICQLIDLGITKEDEIDDRITNSAIWAANSMINSCGTIANDQNTFDFILKLFQSQPFKPNFVNSILQLCIALFNSSKARLIKENFENFFEILFESLDKPEIIIDNKCLETAFSALDYLVNGVLEREPKLQEYYAKVENKFDEYMKILAESGEGFPENKLNLILNLINVFITRLKIDFLPFTENLIELLNKCSGMYRDLTFESILSILSSLCRYLKKDFDVYSENVIEYIKIGYKQDPSIIQQSFGLCSDFMINVNDNNHELIEGMFEIVDDQSDQAQLVIPSFIKRFAQMFLKIRSNVNDFKEEIFTWPEEIINRFYFIVDEQLRNPNLTSEYEKSSQNFNYDIASQIYEGSYYAYAAYFKYQEASEKNKDKAVEFIDKIVYQCAKTKAFDSNTSIALCYLLKVMFNRYENKIASKLNKKFIIKILTDNPEYTDEKSQYREKVNETIKYIRF